MVRGKSGKESDRKRLFRLPSRCRAFTLVEMLVTIVLVGAGIVAVFGGIRALGVADSKARTAVLLQGLAQQKLSEFGAVTDPTGADTSGDFSTQGYPDATWNADVQTTDTDNIDKITVTAVQGREQQALTELLYVPPTTATSTATTGAGAAGQGQ